MADKNGNRIYTPEEAHEMQQRAFNRGATSRPLSGGENAFMSPKWADIDKNLIEPRAENSAPAGLVRAPANTTENRTFGAPNIDKIAAQAAARSGPLNANYAGAPQAQSGGGAAYDRGYRAAQKVGQFEKNKVEPLRSSMGAGTRRNTKDEIRQKKSQARQATARYGAGRNRTMIDGPGDTKAEEKKYVPRGGYIIFFLVLGVAIGKDIIDIISALLDLAGAGLLATAIGAPVGAALGVMSEVIDKITGLITDLIIFSYFAYIGGKWGLRFALTSIGAIIDLVPGLDILPMTTIMFIIAFTVGRIGEAAVSKVTNSTSLGTVYNLGKKVFSSS